MVAVRRERPLQGSRQVENKAVYVFLGVTPGGTDDGGKRFLTIYLHGDGLQMDLGLKTVAQIGLWVLRIAQEAHV